MNLRHLILIAFVMFSMKSFSQSSAEEKTQKNDKDYAYEANSGALSLSYSKLSNDTLHGHFIDINAKSYLSKNKSTFLDISFSLPTKKSDLNVDCIININAGCGMTLLKVSDDFYFNINAQAGLSTIFLKGVSTAPIGINSKVGIGFGYKDFSLGVISSATVFSNKSQTTVLNGSAIAFTYNFDLRH